MEYDYRSESIAWEKVITKKGKPLLDYRGREMYNSIPVPRKDKKTIFCPYCDKYILLETFDVGYGLKDKGCKDCGITMRDFHMKRVNE